MMSLEMAQAQLSIESDVYEACAGSHALVVCTEWDQFRTLDYSRIYQSMMKPANIFDGRLILDRHHLARIGFEVHTLGKPTITAHERPEAPIAPVEKEMKEGEAEEEEQPLRSAAKRHACHGHVYRASILSDCPSL
jgi:hypothetical protein